MGAKDALNEVGDATGAAYLHSLVDFRKGILAIETDGESETKTAAFTVLYGKVGGSEFGNAVALFTDEKVLVIGSNSENQEMGAMRIYEISHNVALMKSEISSLTPESGRTGWSVAVSMSFAIQSPRSISVIRLIIFHATGLGRWHHSRRRRLRSDISIPGIELGFLPSRT